MNKPKKTQAVFKGLVSSMSKITFKRKTGEDVFMLIGAITQDAEKQQHKPKPKEK